MQTHPTRPTTANFKAQALTVDDLRAQAPSVFSPGPMAGLSARYAFVPTSEILQALGERGWVPVNIEQQHVRLESRFGFQKHLIRLRRAEQMQSLDEWNAELVLTNSHDALCAYVLRVWIFRRICSNGLVVSDEAFSTIRFRHASLKAEQVVQASHQIIEFVPRLGALIDRFRNRQLDFAAQALVLRYSSVEQAPIEPRTLLESRRIEDEASDLWTTTNRVGENLLRGGLSDSRRDRRGRIRTFGSLRSIDSKVSLNTGRSGIHPAAPRGGFLSGRILPPQPPFPVVGSTPRRPQSGCVENSPAGRQLRARQLLRPEQGRRSPTPAAPPLSHARSIRPLEGTPRNPGPGLHQRLPRRPRCLALHPRPRHRPRSPPPQPAKSPRSMPSSPPRNPSD
jgi:hypothetical protein